MTSELLTMNKSSIVLAADSAVTINGKKVRMGVEKLFKLSDNPPMGMMIFGNANFDNIPMETLIKQYSKETNFESLESIENIKKDFLSYLGKITPPFDFKKSIDENLSAYISELSDKFKGCNKKDIEDFISDYKEDENLNFVKNLNEFNLYDEVFVKILPDCVSKDESKYVCYILKMKFFQKIIPSSTGVVIAGFSEDDLLPSFVSFDLILNNSGKIESKLLDCKTNYHLGCIVPFAQRDVIDTFLTGSSIMVKRAIQVALLEFLNEYSELIINSVSSNNKIDKKSCDIVIHEVKKIKSINDVTSKKFVDFLNKWDEIVSMPLFVSVSSMTKQDLIEMSYSLINITSMRRKMDSDVESVGGEVAIAIITKGDGFLWVNKINHINI